MKRTTRWASVALSLAGLGGCGTYVPEMQNFWEDPNTALVQIDTLKDHTTCEVVSAVQSILNENDRLNVIRRTYQSPTINLDAVKEWVVEIVLILTVEEKTQFNPSASLNAVYPTNVHKFTSGSVMTMQSAALGLAGQFSSDATRKITVAYGIKLHDYFTGDKGRRIAETAKSGIRCTKPGGAFVDGDLKFHDTLQSALLPAYNNNDDPYGSDFMNELKTAEKATKKDVISHEVTFAVIYGANITPSIKLVDVSGNQGTTPFLGAQRTNTQDIIITMGPTVDGQTSPAFGSTILASQINVGTLNAILNLRN